MLSVSCLILTYASQFITADFYVHYWQFPFTERLEIGLFLLGVSSVKDFFGDYVYFYYVMLIINII